MKKARIFLSAGLVVFALVVVLIVTYVDAGVSHAQQGQTSALQASTPTSVSAPASNTLGLPAITPQTQTAQSANAITTGSLTPVAAFSTSDAIQYVNTHPMPGATLTGAKPVVVKAAFLLSQEVSTLLKGESTGVPDNTLLCYVEVQGTFTFYGGGVSHL